MWTWFTIYEMMNIQPLGRMETTVTGLNLYYIHDPLLQNLTASVQLGGVYSQVLRGPTPRNLVLHVAAALTRTVPPVIPALPPALPAYTLPSIGGGIAANWRV